MIILPLIIAIGSIIAFGIIVNAIAYIKMKCCPIKDSIYTNNSEISEEYESTLASSEQSLDYLADNEEPLFDAFPDYPHSI
jgi:F0F1-type ATP synthase membrane subunit b/b'